MRVTSLKALLFAAPAVLIFADQAQAAAAAETPPGHAVLEELVVTARRRQENIQTTPVAVTALTSETLREKAVGDIRELALATPSLTTTSVFSTTHVNFSMRGRSAENNQFGNAQVVQVYFADVPQMSAPLAQFYDLNSVQVLRGPQGTLFGRASNGGAILFAPKMPNGQLGGYAQAQVGDLNDYEFEGAVSFPIVSDVLSARVAANIVRRDGYTHVLNLNNLDLDDKHSDSFRIATRFTPVSWASNELIYDHVDIDQHLGSTFLLAARPRTIAATLLSPSFPNYALFLNQNPDLAAIPGVAGGLLAYLDTVRALGPRQLYLDQPANELIFQNTVDVWSNKTQLDFNGLTITNIAGYQRERRAQGYAADGIPLPLLGGYIAPDLRPNGLANKRHQYTDELRLSGATFAKRLDWLVGAYYQELKDETPGNTLMGSAVPITGLAASYVPNKFDIFSRALFTHESLQITDRLRLSGGWRRTREANKSVQAAIFIPLSLRGQQKGPAVCLGTNIPANFDLPQCQGAHSNLKSQGDNWIVGADYKLTSSLFAYASASKGFKPGGVNTTATIPALRTFGMEEIKQYEAGLKFEDEIQAVPVRVNLAAYQQDLTNAQVGYVVFNPARRTTEGVSLNAPKSVVRGVEIEAEAIFNRWVRANGFFDYTNAKYTDFGIPNFVVDPSAPGGVRVSSVTDVTSNPFPNTPKYHFGATVRVGLPVPETLGDMAISATYFYQSSFVFSADLLHEPEGVGPGYGLVNAEFLWRNMFGRNVDLTAFIKNATNKVYIRGGLALEQQLGLTHTTYGEPRTYGLQLRYRFGAE